MLQGFLFLSWIVLEQQLGELEAGERQLWAESYLGADLDCLLVIFAGFLDSFVRAVFTDAVFQVF